MRESAEPAILPQQTVYARHGDILGNAVTRVAKP